MNHTKNFEVVDEVINDLVEMTNVFPDANHLLSQFLNTTPQQLQINSKENGCYSINEIDQIVAWKNPLPLI